MKQIKLLLLLFGIMFTISCNKELSDSNPQSPAGTAGTTNDSVLLWKFIELDTTYAVPMDTVKKTIYSYDSQKRLNREEEYVFDNTGGITGAYVSSFVYNGTDTLPVKIFKLDISNGKNDSTYLQYNAGGFVIKDSTVKGNAIAAPGSVKMMVQNITILTDSVVTSYLAYNGIAPTYFSSASMSRAQTKTGSAITQEKVYSGVFLPNVLKLDFLFDTKPNPLYPVTIHYPYYWIDDQVYRAQKNNYTDAVVYLGTSFRRHLIYHYKYRSDGLPLEAAIENTDLVYPPDVTKVKYYYTK